MENNLGGGIPSQLGQLSKLGSLMLSSINVSGTVPASLYNISSLEELSISANQLHGRLPAGLGSTLPNLQNFYVGANRFGGPIPSSLANASGLVSIDIDTNYFIGPMPLNLGTLRDIEYLNFVDNLLGQSYESNNLKNFIDCLSNSSNLAFLDLDRNSLEFSEKFLQPPELCYKMALPHQVMETVNSNIIMQEEEERSRRDQLAKALN
ncbi:hypothetical protein RHSIM_RhsimUnG0201500 [Rhododendron simsii]|uniref:Uncharacterized protein n=1 Tax=Rhododendron simsii TaxID=118357 RepID=A0A834L269_RHOSS|nr:hypothetical protein RHSIM_RhsimUnG0201500 [Rhododendron simsii]